MGNERDRHSTVIVEVRFNRFDCVVVKLSFVDDVESVRFHAQVVEGMRSKAIVKTNQIKQPDCRPCAVTMVVLCPGGPLATTTTTNSSNNNCSAQPTSWRQWQTVELPMVLMRTCFGACSKTKTSPTLDCNTESTDYIVGGSSTPFVVRTKSAYSLGSV